MSVDFTADSVRVITFSHLKGSRHPHQLPVRNKRTVLEFLGDTVLERPSSEAPSVYLHDEFVSRHQTLLQIETVFNSNANNLMLTSKEKLKMFSLLRIGSGTPHSFIVPKWTTYWGRSFEELL